MIRAVFFDVRALLYGPQGPELLAEVLRGEAIDVTPDDVAEGLSRLSAHLREARLQIHTEKQEDAYHRAMIPALLEVLGVPVGASPSAYAAPPGEPLAGPTGGLVRRLVEALHQYPAWWSMYPETLPVLEELKCRGLILGVIANWEPSLRRFLTEFEIDPYFEVILSSMEAGVAKPDPRLFLQAVEAVGRDPAEALHCGPSIPEDVEGALAAGMVPIWVNRTGISTGHEVLSVNDLRGLLMLAGQEGEKR